MSRQWSSSSSAIRGTLDPRLQKLVDRLLHEVSDIKLLCGHRTKEDQDLAFVTKRSKVRWPNSKHNSSPSKAVDLTSSPVNLKAAKLREELSYIAGAAKVIAAQEGFKLRWGGDWDRDGDLDDNTFDDLFHLEIDE